MPVESALGQNLSRQRGPKNRLGATSFTTLQHAVRPGWPCCPGSATLQLNACDLVRYRTYLHLENFYASSLAFIRGKVLTRSGPRRLGFIKSIGPSPGTSSCQN